MVEDKQTQVPPNRMVRPVGPRPMPAAFTLTPKEVFGILRRHVFLIICLTISGFIAGGVSWFLLQKYLPKYTAQTFIRVLPPVEKDPMTFISPQVNKDIQYAARLSIANLITQQSSLESLLASDKVQETEWFLKFADIKDKRIQKAFKDLEKRFRAYAQRDGDFVVVSMRCGDKKEAAIIVNEMVRLFLNSQGQTKKSEASAKLTRLNEQLRGVKRDLDAAEDALGEVREGTGFSDLEERRFESAIELKINELETQQSDISLMITQLQTNIEILDRQTQSPVNEQIENEIERDPTMIMLTQQLVSQETLLAGRLTKFGENHRVVRQTREQINETRTKRENRKVDIAQQTRMANLQNARDQLVGFESTLEELIKLRQEALKEKMALDLARVQYQQRASIRDERLEMLDMVKESIEKQKIILDDPEAAKIQSVGLALPPREISFPKWQIFFPGGTMLGLMFGIGLAFLIEMLNDLVRTPRDVSRYLHIPLLGVIPDGDEDHQLDDINLCHVVRQSPYSAVSESYRRLRTNIKLSDSSQSSSVLLVSSGMAGDGKTSVAVNLAETFIAENKKILLIDANFWQPNLHTLFQQKAQPEDKSSDELAEFGLSTFLAGLCSYQEIIKPSGIEGLDIVCSGPLPPNPAELLSNLQMQRLVKKQREEYDYIIIDGPPVLLVSAVKILARTVDTTILVFNAAATRRGAALRTIRELREVNVAIIGCVLFAVQAMKGGYFAEQFKSYQEYQKLQLAHST